MDRSWLLLAGLMMGVAPALYGQQLRVDRRSAVARASLGPDSGMPRATRPVPGSAASVADTTEESRRSRAGAAGLGFLAGAAGGLVVAYFVDQSRDSGDGRLENYLGIPLAMGTVTFMSVFIGRGD